MINIENVDYLTYGYEYCSVFGSKTTREIVEPRPIVSKKRQFF